MCCRRIAKRVGLFSQGREGFVRGVLSAAVLVGGTSHADAAAALK